MSRTEGENKRVPVTSQSGFRPEIQALRALAVALVVVFHLTPSRLPGGFVGVDVFFVVSGYLITAHLLAEVERTGTVRVVAFWGRRIRRLLPAALLVLAATAVLTFLVVPRSLREQTFREIGASALYVQNWVLAGDSVDYLAADNAPTLVQHYWSLSVEEQFYFVWPLLILLALLISRSKRAILVVLGLIFTASLVYSVIATAANPASAYFVTPTRAWEFAAGGLLAGFGLSISGRRAVAASWLGIGMIGAAALLYSSETPFPGYTALLPVVGAVLVMAAGNPTSDWSPMVIGGWRPVQLIGDLSYSIYLWHWPLILVYPLVVGHPPKTKGMLVILAVTLVLAWLTKRFVEDPFRSAEFWQVRLRRTFAFAVGGMALVVATVAVGSLTLQTTAATASDPACVGAASVSPTCDNQFDPPVDLDTAEAAADRPDDWCIGEADGIVEVTCDFGVAPRGSVPTIALLGDSHAAVWRQTIDDIAQRNGWSGYTSLKTGCPAVPAPPLAGIDPPQRAIDCSTWSERAVEAIASHPTIDLVIFAHASNARFYYAGLTQDEYADMFDRLQGEGRPVVVILDVPGTERTKAPECIDQWQAGGEPCLTPRDVALAGIPVIEAAAIEAGVQVFDATDVFCDDKNCHVVVGGIATYFDSDHLTQTFAGTLAPALEETLLQVLAPAG